MDKNEAIEFLTRTAEADGHNTTGKTASAILALLGVKPSKAPVKED